MMRAPWPLRIAALLLLVCCCARAPKPERIVSAPDASVPAFSAVKPDLPRDLRFTLRGPDFEDARERSCTLEASIEKPDAGEPVLVFRCAQLGAP